MWSRYRRQGPSEEAKTALFHSQVSLALASDINARSAHASEGIRRTLERNHLVESIEATILGEDQ